MAQKKPGNETKRNEINPQTSKKIIRSQSEVKGSGTPSSAAPLAQPADDRRQPESDMRSSVVGASEARLVSRVDPDFGDLVAADLDDGLDADGPQAIGPAAGEPNPLDDIDALGHLDDEADAAPAVEIIPPTAIEIEVVGDDGRFGMRAQGPATEGAQVRKAGKGKSKGAPCPSSMTDDERHAELAFLDMPVPQSPADAPSILFGPCTRLVGLATGKSIGATKDLLGRFRKQMANDVQLIAAMRDGVAEIRRDPKLSPVSYLSGVIAQRTKGLTRAPGGRVAFTDDAVDDALAQLKAERAARGQA